MHADTGHTGHQKVTLYAHTHAKALSNLPTNTHVHNIIVPHSNFTQHSFYSIGQTLLVYLSHRFIIHHK